MRVGCRARSLAPWVLVAGIAVAPRLAAQSPRTSAPWMDARRPVDVRARALLACMTLEEKFWQLYMAPGDPLRDTIGFVHGAYGVQLLDLRGESREAESRWTAVAHADSVQRFFVERTRLGIPAILFEEGVHGLMQQGATAFPQAIALAATWDTALVGRVAREIARQSRERGVRQLLSPVINLARDPRWGRVEETYGEDVLLSSAMGVAFVRALEQAGVVATPKHFVANYGDGGRDSYPVALDRATLEDLYFPPFHAAISAGGARSIMASYNSVNGLPATANADLLTRTLRDAWKFGGVVIADQGGVGGANVLHHTAADYADATAGAMRVGLDVIFQSNAADARLFWPAFRDGKVPRAVVDTAVLRVLRLKFALGLFDHPYAHDPSRDPQRAEPERRAYQSDLARIAAEASMVLLRNARSTLPWRADVGRIAVIGTGADSIPLGDYSVRPPHMRSLIEVLNGRRPGRDSVLHAQGPGLGAPALTPVDRSALLHDSLGVAVPGLRAEYFAKAAVEGTPAAVRVDGSVDFNWTFMRPTRGLGTDWYSVRWTGVLQVPAGDNVRVAIEGDDGYRLWIDDTLVVDADRKVSYGVRVASGRLAPGAHALRLEYRQTTGTGRIRLLWDKHAAEVTRAEDAQLGEAVAVARRADVALVTVGVDEGEFRDRASLRLPGRQQELIERVAATGTPVVVVIFAGGAVITSPWMERVGAVLQAFYPGEAGAEAIVNVLFGDANPSGRLPYTVPRSEGQLPLVYDHLPTGRGDDYVDLTGQPLFPFGYGLSYTDFTYRDLTLARAVVSAADTVRVRLFVKNSGARAGHEVLQLYVRHVTAPTAQPVLALRDFARLWLLAGEERAVAFALPGSAFAVRDVNGRRAVVDGDVTLYVGASSRDIRLRAMLKTQGSKR